MKDRIFMKEKKLSHFLILGFTLFLLLFLGILISISVGALNIPLRSVMNALFSFDGSKEHIVIRAIRLPRAILSLMIGAALAVAGSLMQGITRNPLASPQLFGTNAGAVLVVVGAITLFPSITGITLIYFAFLGATLGGMLVYFVASERELNPMKLVLAGMAIHLLLSSMTQGMILFSEHSKESVIFWLAGSTKGASWQGIQAAAPWIVLGIGISCFLGKPLSILALGDDMATGIGQNVQFIRFIVAVMTILLSGAAVSLAGPIGFVGLMVPHITRKLVGLDYKWIIPFSALVGAVLLIYSDIISRFIAYPFESPVGIVTTLIGAPYLLFLAQKGGKKS